MSLALYISMAVDSAVRAGSRWPVAAYSVPRPQWQWAWSGRIGCVGQGEGLLVVGFGLLDLRGIAPRRNLAEEAQVPRLIAPFRVLTGMRQRPLSEGVRLLRAASQQMRLTQGETTECWKGYRFPCSGLFHRLREQPHGVGDAPAQGVRRTQGRSHPGEIGWEVRVLTNAFGTFE